MPRPEPPRPSPRGSLILPLPPRAFPLAPAGVVLGGRHFAPKSELHLTLLAADQLAALAARGLDPAALAALLAPLRFRFRWTRRPLLIERRGAEGLEASVILPVRQPDQQRLRARLAARTGLALGSPFPHVTLYTHRCPEGIGVPSRAALAALAPRPVPFRAILPPGERRCRA
ncbi:MAG: hypothetical protein RML12_01200 [Xanthomonadales bacterium]|nr:hypothetical protein [Xanthomonadales bacterium]